MPSWACASVDGDWCRACLRSLHRTAPSTPSSSRRRGSESIEGDAAVACARRDARQLRCRASSEHALQGLARDPGQPLAQKPREHTRPTAASVGTPQSRAPRGVPVNYDHRRIDREERRSDGVPPAALEGSMRYRSRCRSSSTLSVVWLRVRRLQLLDRSLELLIRDRGSRWSPATVLSTAASLVAPALRSSTAAPRWPSRIARRDGRAPRAAARRCSCRGRRS